MHASFANQLGITGYDSMIPKFSISDTVYYSGEEFVVSGVYALYEESLSIVQFKYSLSDGIGEGMELFHDDLEECYLETKHEYVARLESTLMELKGNER